MAKTIKTYKSKDFLSFSLVTGKEAYKDPFNGGVYYHDTHTRIVFRPGTLGEATFTTDNADLQEKLEACSLFGKRFFLAKTVSEEEVKEEKAKAVKAAEKKTEPTKVEVSDASEAKQYLVDKFELARTQIRTLSDIKKYAERNNIEFVGI